jgi:hypothetical protein
LPRAIDGYDGQPTTRLALKLSVLLSVRTQANSVRREGNRFRQGCLGRPGGDDDDEAAASRTACSPGHCDPAELHGMTGRSEFVFPAVDFLSRCMSNNTLNAGLRRLGFSKEEVSVSGFRATASTRLNKIGRWNSDAIERQLAHMEENDVRRAYMQAAQF